MKKGITKEELLKKISSLDNKTVIDLELLNKLIGGSVKSNEDESMVVKTPDNGFTDYYISEYIKTTKHKVTRINTPTIGIKWNDLENPIEETCTNWRIKLDSYECAVRTAHGHIIRTVGKDEVFSKIDKIIEESKYIHTYILFLDSWYSMFHSLGMPCTEVFYIRLCGVTEEDINKMKSGINYKSVITWLDLAYAADYKVTPIL